jgi:hypothetical protein
VLIKINGDMRMFTVQPKNHWRSPEIETVLMKNISGSTKCR